MFANEAAVVDVDKHAHQKSGISLVSAGPSNHGEYADVLAIHSVCHTTVPRNTVSKVLDVEGALETRSEKAAKWRDQRGETSHEEQMELIWHI